MLPVPVRPGSEPALQDLHARLRLGPTRG
jgi:hypothetical protein